MEQLTPHEIYLDSLSRELIVDADVTLRLRDDADAEATFALVESCRPYLREFLPWVDGTKTVDDCRQFIQSRIEKFEAKQNVCYGISYKGELCGIMGFNSIDSTNHNAEIGYWLAESFQGQGIMTRAVARLIQHGFDDLNLHRIELHAATKNLPSCALAERTGFTREGVMKDADYMNGQYYDLAIYGLVNQK